MGVCIKSLKLSVAALSLCTSAYAQDASPSSQSPPQSCLDALETPAKWVACALEADPGSEESLLAYSNLGAQAFFNQDFESAGRYFDMSTPSDGGESYLDTFAHALRASTYWRVGEDKKAQTHAKFAYNWIEKNQIGPLKDTPFSNDLLEPVLEVLVPVMTYLSMPEAGEALARYQSLPLTSLTTASRRAGVLSSVGAYDAALVYSARAVSGQPDNPVYLINHCNLLTKMDLPETAISFCTSAVEIEPENAEFRFTKALTLAALHQCDAAWTEQSKARTLDPGYPLFEEELPCQDIK